MRDAPPISDVLHAPKKRPRPPLAQALKKAVLVAQRERTAVQSEPLEKRYGLRRVVEVAQRDEAEKYRQ